MVHVIRIEDLPALPVDGGAGAATMRKIISPESVGAKHVGGEAHDLGGGASSPPFQSDEQRQFFYVLAGRAEVRLGDERRSVRAGHVVYADPGESCRFTDCGEEGFRFLRFVIGGNR